MALLGSSDHSGRPSPVRSPHLSAKGAKENAPTTKCDLIILDKRSGQIRGSVKDFAPLGVNAMTAGQKIIYVTQSGLDIRPLDDKRVLVLAGDRAKARERLAISRERRKARAVSPPEGPKPLGREDVESLGLDAGEVPLDEVVRHLEAARRRGAYPLLVVLERLLGGDAAIGTAANLDEERIQLRHDRQLAFRAAEVSGVRVRDVNFSYKLLARVLVQGVRERFVR